MPDDSRNPYAPPAEPNRFDERATTAAPDDYERERRSVALCIGLTLLTLGFYPTIWLLQRRPFLDRRDASVRLSAAAPVVILVANVLSFVVLLSPEAERIRPLFSLVAGIGTVLANFRVLAILRSDSSRTGRFLEFSTLGTFFFGIYYLQYKINQLADMPAHVAKPRRKKKRKKPADAPEADAPPPADP